MSNQNAPPPGQQQSRSREQTQDRAREQTQERPADRAPPAREIPQPAAETGKKQDSALKPEKAVAVAGHAGERHISIEWVPVQISGHVPVYFIVTTAAGNPLEVQVEQLVYHKSYAGTEKVQTNVIPIAPIGTKVKVSVRDTATGETLEQIGTWRLIGGGSLFGWLFSMLKRLFTNTKD
jgi:hypothetical protein